MDGRCIHRWMETKWGVYHIALKQGKGLGSRKTRVTVNLEEIAQKLTLGWALSLSLLSSPFSLPSASLSLSLSLSLALSLSSCLAPFAAMKPLPYLIKNYVPPATTIVGRDFQGQAANISLLWNINLVIDLVLETKPGMGFLWFSGEASGLRTTSHAKPATVPKG